MWAIGTILVKRLRGEHEIDLLNLTTWQMVFGALVVAAASGFVHEAAVQWNAQFIAILLFMTLISTCLCWVLWLYILGRLPAWEASLSVLGTPVIAIVSSRWQTGESFSLQELAGILLIGAGLGLLSLLGWRASRRAAALTSS
jgi:drug/metabolite transporter (DMT)-like permease